MTPCNAETYSIIQMASTPALTSVRQLADRCDDQPVHSRNVAKIALSLFENLQKKLDLDDSCRRYLEAAALLTNVGVVVSHSKHHLHSYYVIAIQNSSGLRIAK
ncbi:hypothetical protein EMGBS4_14190 [Acidimicrobiaceae bacterium]|nr:hypothetical protein EMGBS4_14190 [Acidimicrobiaceae bacterium]